MVDIVVDLMVDLLLDLVENLLVNLEDLMGVLVVWASFDQCCKEMCLFRMAYN